MIYCRHRETLRCHCLKSCKFQGFSTVTKEMYELRKSLPEFFSCIFSAEINLVRRIKQDMGYVPLDYDQELTRHDIKTYQLPDGNQISLDKEQFQCFEALFQPRLIGKLAFIQSIYLVFCSFS